MRKFDLVFWFFLILNLIFLQGCHKKEPSTVYIPEQLKVYSVFQVGSFWIYKNETTGEIDSTIIQVSPQFSYIQISGDGPIFEKCVINFDSPLISSSYTYLDEYWITLKNGLPSICLRSTSFQPGYIYAYNQFSYFKNISYSDSLIINDNVFYNVMNTLYKTITLNLDTITYTFYLAKSVGLVKLNIKINNNDTTWSLIKHHAVQ